MARGKSVTSNTYDMPNDNDPRQVLINLVRQRAELAENLVQLERQIYKFEESYLSETANGNIVRGWDCYSNHTVGRREQPKKDRKIKDTDRLFSKSSITSPAAIKHLGDDEKDSSNDDAHDDDGHTSDEANISQGSKSKGRAKKLKVK